MNIFELVTKYPKIFPEPHTRSHLPKGWIPCVDWLCESIQEYMDNPQTQERKVEQLVCEQFKDKFGSLRFYVKGGDFTTRGMIRMAQKMCENTCEECGTHDNLGRTMGWVAVMCENCHKNSESMSRKKWVRVEQPVKNS